MPNVRELQIEQVSLLEAAKTICETAEKESRDFTPEERTAVQKSFDDASAVAKQIQQIGSDEDLKKSIGDLFPKGFSEDATEQPGAKGTVGQKFTENEAIKAWLKSMDPSGQGIAKNSRVHSPAVQFGGVKDIISGGVDTSAGALVQNQFLGLVDPLGTFQRELTIRDLITTGQTGSDTVEYSRVTGFTNGADTVAEAKGVEPYSAGSGQVQGKKPQSNLILEKVSTTVSAIAHWLPVTKRALSDAGQVRTLIDNFLRYGLEEELEDQIVSGGGSGEDFEGILTVEGTQDQAWDTNLLVTTRKAKTKVKLGGRARATAYVLNPADNERIDLLRDASGGDEDTGQFLFGSPTGTSAQTLWGLPRIESEAVPEGTGIVGDFKQAVLWDREQASIMVSDSHEDFFIRNLVAILAEMRAAFGVIRPAAFVLIDLESGES